MTKLAILGAGPGGYVAALKAAHSGVSVVLIEDYEVGGTCLHWGCIATKTIVATVEVLSKIKESDSFGISLEDCAIKPDMNKILDRKNKVINTQVKGIHGLLKSWGVEFIHGRGKFIGPKKIEVELKSGGTQTVEAEKIIIATGSRPAQIPTFPFDKKRILSSDDALVLNEIPKSMLIIGAGVIGCEYAFIFKELGTKITMVELMPRALSTADEEVAAVLQREIKKNKMTLFIGVTVDKIDVKEDSVIATLSNGKTVETEKVLVSIGRTYNTDNIGLDTAGIETGKRGEVLVNKKMETSQDGVYAIGDCIGGILLAHVASSEGIVAVENALGGSSCEMNYDVIPYGIFTKPELGCVGLTEKEAQDKGFSIQVGRCQYRALGKAHTIGEITGMAKIVAEKGTGKILGGHIIGAHASDMVHELALAMQKGLTVTDIVHTIHAHPTLSEVIMEAAEDVHGQSIHSPKK